MGLNSNARTLFSPAWQEALRGAPESAMDATVLIYSTNSSTEVYDADTDTWTRVPTNVYSGKARVQPLRNANDIAQPGNETTLQSVLVSLPISANVSNFRPGLRLDVLTAPLNPSLLTYQFVLTDIVDSSNPIERTLMFSVDQETAN
jgi:hypothetical protein